MGTTVRCKSYLPGYHPIRVLNEDASGSWSQCYEDNMLSGHLYNGFMLRPMNEYSECDKEMLKQKMLEHEAIFRKQVYELHRLYRIQRDLMDECQKKGLYNYPKPSDTSQSNSISSQMPCEGTKKIWQLSYLPVVNTNCDRAPFARTDDRRSSLNFLKESSVQSGPISIKNGVSLKDGELLDSKVQKFPRRMFDLQLPADVYIDGEDSKRLGDTSFADSSSRVTVPPNGTCSDDPENDVKLTLHTGDGPNCKKDRKVPGSRTQNGLSTNSLVNLNKPIIKDICFQGTVDSASTHFLGLRTHSEGNQGDLGLWTSRSNANSLGLQNVFSKGRDGDEASSSNYLCADKEERRQEWPFFYSESVNTGQSGSSMSFSSQNLSNDKFPIASEPAQLKLKNAHGIVLPHGNKTETWIRQKANYGIETSGSSRLATSNDSTMTAPSTPASFSVLSQTDSSNTAPSLVSSWTKPVNILSHIPIAVQALPCFNGLTTLGMQSMISHAAIQNIGPDHEKWQTGRDSKTCLRAGSEAPSYLNGSLDCFQLDSKHAPYSQPQSITFGEPNRNNTGNSSSHGNTICHEPQKCFKGLQCTDVKSTKDVNLNQALPNGIQNNLAAQQHMVIHGLEQKFEESLQGISWLRKKPACNESVDLKKHASQMELVFTHGHSQLMSSSNVDAPESEKRQDKESGLCNPQGFTSILQGREIGLQRNEISDNLSSRRILGFPIIIDKVQQDAASQQECSLTNDSKCIDKDICCNDLTSGMKEHSSEKPISIGSLITEKGDENISTSVRNCINLNAELSCPEDPSLLQVSPKSEVVVPLPLPAPRASAKVDSEFSLDVLVSQAEGNILSHQEYMSSSKTDGSQEAECSHDGLIREAAENIVAMSVDAHGHLEDIACHPLPPARWDNLFWFADVVSSNADNAGVRRSGGDGSSESSEDGLDYFEAMTLKLEEIKVDECCNKPNEFENKQGATGAASLLLMRPRRGQARRRRQRRDFQKDILPGLASLSRHEVTEDLQAIGGLMKASGKSWKASLTRRNTGRNGLQCQAKGRRQSRNLAVTLSETQDSSPPVDPINADLQVDERNMMGWGKTTRRCRRPRCPPGNVSAPVTLPYPW